MIDVLKPLAAAFALIVLEAVVATINDIREDSEQYDASEEVSRPHGAHTEPCMDVKQDDQADRA